MVPWPTAATGRRSIPGRSDGALPVRCEIRRGCAGLAGCGSWRPEARCSGGPTALSVRRATGDPGVRRSRGRARERAVDPCVQVGPVQRPSTFGEPGPEDRVSFHCSACGWARSYRAARVRDRLQALGEDAGDAWAETAARRVAWPCPRCARMRWRCQVVAGATDRRELLALNAKTGTAAEIRVSLGTVSWEPRRP